MAIDPNIIFNGFNPNLPDANQLRGENLKLQGMDIANQTNQISLDQAKESQAFQKLYNQLLQKYSTHADQSQPVQQSQSQPVVGESDGTGSASLGKDAYGNLIPKIGVESPSGPEPGVPNNLAGPPGSLTEGAMVSPAGAMVPAAGASPYQQPGMTPAAATTSSAGSDSGVPQAASSSLQAGAAPPSSQAAAGNSPSANAPASPGTATITAPNGKSMALPTTYAGISTDYDSVFRDLAKAGYGMHAIGANADRLKVVQQGLQMQEEQFKAEGEKMKALGSIAGSVSTVNDWTNQNQIQMAQASAQNAIQLAASKGLMEPHHAMALLQTISQKGYTPDIQAEIQQSAKQGMTASEQYTQAAQHARDVNTFLNDNINRQEKQAELPGKISESESKQVTAASGRLSQAYSTGGLPAYQQALAGEDGNVKSYFPPAPKSATEIDQAGMNPGQKATDRRAAATLANTKDYQSKRLGQESQRVGIEAARLGNESAQMSQQAVENAANAYNMTGQLPNTGYGKAGAAMRTKIMNRAAELGGGVNLAGNKAAYQANSTSLKNVQKQFDAVNAFENTAFKNLDVFLNQSKKVIDTGSPWINKPLQSVMRTGLGDDDQAAYDTARQTAIQEIAKVLGNPQGGGALSDSQRQEVENLIKPGATFKQIYRAANILKTDMSNRKTSYTDQISDIQKRMNVIGGAGPSAKQSGPTITTQADYDKLPSGTIYIEDGNQYRKP